MNTSCYLLHNCWDFNHETVQFYLQTHKKDTPITESSGGCNSNDESYGLYDSMLHDIPLFPERNGIAYSEEKKKNTDLIAIFRYVLGCCK